MKRFLVLLGKELRELVTPQTIIPIVVIVIVFIGVGRLISQQSKLAKKPQPVVVIDNDNTPQSAAVITLLGKSNLAVTIEHNQPLPDFTQPQSEKGLIVIPAGFGKRLLAGKQATVLTYLLQDGFSVQKLSNSGLLSTPLTQVNAALSASRVKNLAPRADAAAVLAPISNDPHLVVSGKVAAVNPSEVASYIASQIALVPVVLFIVIVFAGQMVATAMANEKENKTLETLLSAPISRTSIVGAKMLAAAIVSGITATAYVYGLHSIQSSFTGSTSLSPAAKAAISSLGLTLSPTSYLLLGLVLFLGILAALAIALVLGAFADNIKSVQSLIMPLMALLLIPYLVSLVADIPTLPKFFQVILYLIPFTYTFQAAPNLYAHQYILVLVGAGYEFVVFIVFMMLGAKLFSSDQLLTLKLPWQKR